MKTYRGFNTDGNAASTHVVTVTDDDSGGTAMLTHRIRHSPTGFSWGYAGSGPAELARSLLWDLLGDEPTPSCYQAFKAEFVARWPQDGNWEITEKQIRSFLSRWLVAAADRFATVVEYEASLTMG